MKNQALNKCVAVRAPDLHYEVEALTLADKTKILNFQNCALSELGSVYQPMTEEFIQNALSGGFCLGLYVHNELVGMRLCHVVDKEKHGGIIFFCGSYILAPHRQKKLGQKLMKSALSKIKAAGFSHVYTTVHPFNYPSLHTLLSCGFSIIDVGTKYEDKLRYTVYLDLQKRVLKKKIVEHAVMIDNCDLEKQKKLLANDFIGVSVISHLDQRHVCFAKIYNCELLNEVKNL